MAEPTYSPRLRTAVVLAGAGTAGAYQAGALRALAEAGVKIDLLAAHGVGVMTALCGAIDGGGRLWNPPGPWLAPAMRRAYGWRPALRAAGVALAAAGALLLSPILVLVFAALIYAFSLLAGLVGLAGASSWFVELYRRSLTALFQPPLGPTVISRGVVIAGLVVLGILCGAAVKTTRHDRGRRRWRGAFWWRVFGAPIDVEQPETALVTTLWDLVRGSSTEPQPAPEDIGRRYVDILAENLGQPGFRELLIAVHDVDGRRDSVGAVLPVEARPAFAARRNGAAPREAETVDFAGAARELVVDFLKGSLRVPAVAPAHACQFPADGYWRGEVHRLCDRPELVGRLIDEIAIVGIEQVVFVSAAEPPALPHGMRSTPLDFRGRAGELLRSIETSALQDAWTAAVSRFSGVFVVRPDHNAIGPFGFAGVYDASSDRVRTLSELMKQGYDDAYRQFIEPVVAAGEKNRGDLMAMHRETRVLHVGEGAQDEARPLTRPIYATSTFVFESAAELEAYQKGESHKYLYSRYANPSVQAVEEKLAVLEGGEAALVTSSGMAATSTALFGLLRAGEELVCSSAIYGGTLHVVTGFLERFGVRARFVTTDELGRLDSIVGRETKVLWFESPINPTLRCVDIAQAAAACRARGVVSILDSTFASPVNQQPLDLGVDLVMHSATKYLNGHSDVTAGALVGSRALIERLQSARKLFGGVLEPASAYALARGLKTLHVRVARQNDSARKVAEWCERSPGIGRVFYPGLPSHPDHAVAKKQMSGFGGMVTIDIAGGYGAACRVFDRLRVIQRAASLGGVESLCSLPLLTSHFGCSEDQLAAAGVTPGMMRISIGLEHPEDLIEDLRQALD